MKTTSINQKELENQLQIALTLYKIKSTLRDINKSLYEMRIITQSNISNDQCKSLKV